MIVLDTSAWLKCVLRHEPHVDKVDAIIAQHLEGLEQILVPYVAWAEALWVLRERLALPWADMRQAVEMLWFPRLKVIPPTRRLLVASTEIGERYNIQNPDTIFVAASALRQCELITDDRPLVRQMERKGIGWVRLLRDYPV